MPERSKLQEIYDNMRIPHSAEKPRQQEPQQRTLQELYNELKAVREELRHFATHPDSCHQVVDATAEAASFAAYAMIELAQAGLVVASETDI